MAGGHFRSPSRTRRQAIHIREQQPFSRGLPDTETQGIALRDVPSGRWWEKASTASSCAARQQRGQFVGRTVVNGDDLRACWPLLTLHRCPPCRPILRVVLDAYDDTDRGLVTSGCARTQRTQASPSQGHRVRDKPRRRPPTSDHSFITVHQREVVERITVRPAGLMRWGRKSRQGFPRCGRGRHRRLPHAQSSTVALAAVTAPEGRQQRVQCMLGAPPTVGHLNHK